MDQAAPTPTDELVHLTVADGVATITLDSQHNRNALSRRLVEQLVQQLDVADADESVLAIVIAAEGKAFCAGADLSEATGEGMEQGARGMLAMQRRIVAAAKPVVVRLHAAVRAGGLGIVGAADVVVAADDVTFAFTEARLGLAPAVISLTTLPRLTSRAASRTFLTGEQFTAAQAVEMGLVSEAVPADRLDDAVRAVTGALRLAHPQGLRETKAMLNAPLVAGIDEHGEQMATLSARLFGSDGAREAMTAFLNRRR